MHQTPNDKTLDKMNKNSEQLSSRKMTGQGKANEAILTASDVEKSATSTSLTRQCRTKQFSQHQTWRNHSMYATRKEVDKKLRASGERSTNQSTRTS